MRSNLLARLLIALALVLGATIGSIPAAATAFSTDQSDLWWNPAESGWGVQFVQTGSAVFATMYVYGSAGQPMWYSATLDPQPAASTWSGDLYVGTGPWFGTAPFDPASVAPRKVGTMTWTALSTESGALTYGIDGVVVSKTIYRQTLRYDDQSGTYSGAFYFTRGCGSPVVTQTLTPITVTQGPNQLVVKASFDPRYDPGDIFSLCTFTGDYAQFGHFGRSQGTFACADGSLGTHDFTQMTVQTVGWTRLWSALLAGVDGAGCKISGHLFGTSGPTPTAGAPTCTITPNQTITAGTSVTLALANCSPGAGLTYSWNQDSLTGPQVSTAATYTTPLLTANTTYFATVSANGSSTTYQVTVIVKASAPGSCSGYTTVYLGDLSFDGLRIATEEVIGSAVVYGRIVVPSGQAGKVTSIAIFEYIDPQLWKRAYLSKSPCDFTAAKPAFAEGTSLTLRVQFDSSLRSDSVRMNAGEVWYLTVKNESLTGEPSCPSGRSCNFAIRMGVPTN